MTTPSTIVGRDAELETIRSFVVGSARDDRALLIAGEAGMGKTRLWTEGVVVGRAAGQRVLRASPAEADTRRSFSGLTDLFDSIADGLISRLPGPQRRALTTALLRTDTGSDATAAETAIGPAVLGLLRLLAARGPVLVAIDDLPWLDAASATALAFAARRLDRERIRFLLARRNGGLSRFEREARGVTLGRLDIGPLSLGATRQLLADRLGLTPSRREMRHLHEQSRGNPLFALELAALGSADAEASGTAIPAAIDEVLGARFDALPPRLREVLLAVALTPGPSLAELTSLVGPRRVEAAARAGLIVLDGSRARPGHPLLAEVAVARSGPGTTRAVHAALARVAEDDDARIRHRAMASVAPDSRLAEQLDLAAERAGARAALADAVDLAAASLRLTPPEDPARMERVLRLADRMILAGEHGSVVELVTPALAALPAGPLRARARLLLVEGGFYVTGVHMRQATAAMDAAVEDAASDPRLLSVTLARRALHDAIGPVTGLRAAERRAREALELATDRAPDARADGAYALGWTAHIRGHWPRELVSRPIADEPDVMRGLGRILAERFMVEGRIPEARERFERLLALADERGQAWSYVAVRLQLIELELRAGSWDRAAELLDEWAYGAEKLTSPSGYERTRALLEGGRGDADAARRWATTALEHSEARGLGWDRLESLRALGLAEMAAGRPERARESLQIVWDATRRAHIVDPGLFPVAAELVEALLATGDARGASHIARAVARFGRTCGHPWARVTGLRTAALVDFEVSRDPSGPARLWAAADEYADLGLLFDRGRTLLALGRAARRHRQWGDARHALEAAVATFDSIGSGGWSDLARDDLSRIGGRRPAGAATLTPAERRVADLAIDGLANKEIAGRLGVSTATVERHLSRAYAKVGVASRTQLIRRLGDPPGG